MNTSASVMTTRQFLTAIMAAELPEELTTKAAEMLAALDAKNEKRKSSDSKEKRETRERREAVLGYLRTNEGAHTRDEIAEAVGITPAQASSACTALFKEELIDKSEVKIDKSRKTAYSIK